MDNVRNTEVTFDLRRKLREVSTTYPDPYECLTHLLRDLLPKCTQLFSKQPELSCLFVIQVYRNLNNLPNGNIGNLVRFLFSSEHKQWAKITAKINTSKSRVQILLPGFRLVEAGVQTCFYKQHGICTTNICFDDVYLTNQGLDICVSCYKNFIIRSFEHNSYSSIMSNPTFNSPECYFEIKSNCFVCCNCTLAETLGVSVPEKTNIFHVYYPCLLSVKRVHVICDFCFPKLESNQSWIPDQYCSVCASSDV